jgi:PAS domain S-box-containing protein
MVKFWTIMDRADRMDESLESQLKATLDIIPAFTWYATPSGVLLFVNARCAEYLGLPDDHPLRHGTDIGAAWDAHIPLLHPDDHEETRRVWSDCLKTGRASEVSFRVRNAAGQYRWFLSRAEPRRGNDGTILCWIGINVDIEERKRAEQELRDIVDTIPAVVWVAMPDGSNGYVNSRFVAYSGMVPAQTAGTGWREAVHPNDIQAHDKKWHASVASGEPLENEVRFRGAHGEYRWHLNRGLPLRDAEGNIIKWYGVVTDIDDRKRAEEALRRSEHYLAEAQGLSHTGSFGWKPESGEIVWSDETYRIFEYDRAIRPTLDLVMQRIHPQDRALTQAVIERAFQTGAEFEHETRLLLPDGRVKYIHAIAHAAASPPGDREFVGAVTDITERKTTEDKIQRLVETDILGIFIANVQGEITEANKAFLQMLQYGRQDLQSGRLRWRDLTPVELRERDERTLTEALSNGLFQPYEKEFLRKDGSRLPVLIGGALFQSAKEGVVFVLDLSEQKRAAATIRGQEMELLQMLDFTPLCIGVVGADGTPLYANRASLDYLGMSLDEWRQKGPIANEAHPDDLERLTAELSRASSTGTAFELELRVLKGDGSARWFLSRFSPLHDDNGQLKRWFIASTDIEDRKRAEERLQQENVALREEIDQASMFEEIVGASAALNRVLARVSKVAATDSTVLINGETGTGKELVARAIHRRSPRASRGFVAVNCAAIPRDLIASELFGHEKGAFTGALQRRLGRFELADGGTIFLDEVGELAADTQVALLRVLQEREFERVGGQHSIRVDVRVIAATNRDLNEAVADGAFRQDLFYRLNVFPLEMPPLRERQEDIAVLVEYFIDRYARKAGKTIRRVSKQTLERLKAYPWPGNVRELQNVIERSVIVSDNDEFVVDESWLSTQPPFGNRLGMSRELSSHEKALIEDALRATGGRVFGPSGAAARLGIPRSTLESKIRTLKINKSRFRTPKRP